MWFVIVTMQGVDGEANEWLQPGDHINGFLQSARAIGKAGSV